MSFSNILLPIKLINTHTFSSSFIIYPVNNPNMQEIGEAKINSFLYSVRVTNGHDRFY